MKKVISLDKVKEIEKEVLVTIHNFCIDNNINYSLGYGTLLGAIRHKGFIPWDDDIDIILPRKDNEYLLSIFPKVHNSVSIGALERNPKWNRPYANAYDIRTLKIEDIDDNVEDVGIGIDIFPIDEVPNDLKKWERYNKKRRILLFLYLVKTIKIKKGRNLIKNTILLLAKLLILISSRKLALIINNFALKGAGHNSCFVFETVEDLSSKERFSKSWFNDYCDVEFENNKFRAIACYDAFLKAAYGDYMTLPPKEKQITHHSYTAYWKNCKDK